MTADNCSRFFLNSDQKKSELIFKMPDTWWSRPAEYAWASGFAAADDIALDAASGIEHPLKFYLLDHCRESHANDLDERILSHTAIKKAIVDTFGREIAESLPERYLSDVQFSQGSLTEMPYPDQYFDKIYCISVLEHLSDRFNRWFWLLPFRRFIPGLSRLIEQSLREFKRVLKGDGSIILTFDYPSINLDYFRWLVKELGFEFSGPVDFSLPTDALFSEKHKLYCFRAVIRKK